MKQKMKTLIPPKIMGMGLQSANNVKYESALKYQMKFIKLLYIIIITITATSTQTRNKGNHSNYNERDNYYTFSGFHKVLVKGNRKKSQADKETATQRKARMIMNFKPNYMNYDMNHISQSITYYNNLKDDIKECPID